MRPCTKFSSHLALLTGQYYKGEQISIGSKTYDELTPHRRRIMCSLDGDDSKTARLVYDGMTDESKREPATQYLLFKIAIATEDCQTAAHCLKSMLENKSDINNVLACAHAAQKAHAKHITLEATQSLIACHDAEPIEKSRVALVALYRCSIRLLQGLVDEPMYAEEPEIFIQRLCGFFESGEYSFHKK